MAALQNAAIEVGFYVPEGNSTVPMVPSAIVPGHDPAAGDLSLTGLFQGTSETLNPSTSITLPEVTSQGHLSDICPGVPLPPAMASQQLMPSLTASESTAVQVSTSELLLSAISPAGSRSPTQLSASVNQSNDPAACEEPLTYPSQHSPPSGDVSEQPSTLATEPVSQSNDAPVPKLLRQISSSESSPHQPSLKSEPLKNNSPVLEASSSFFTESSSVAPQPLPPISESKPQNNDDMVSGSPWLWRGGAAAELSEYQPVPIGEKSKADLSLSRKPILSISARPSQPPRRSTPIITDTNHGLPIVIYDTDEEFKEEIDESKTKMAAFCDDSRLREPEDSHKHNLRKRVRAREVTDDQWIRPQYERKLLRKLRLAFYQHEYKWMCVRELPEAIAVATVDAHNEFVKEFGKVCRETEVVSVKDTRTLRNSFMGVSNGLLTMVHRGTDRDAIVELGALIDEIQDYAMTLASIYAFRSGGDDPGDDTYRPSKKRRV
jgi:hypothetical protein